MKKVILKKTFFLRRKDKKDSKKKLVVNSLELIRVKKTMIQTMKLVEYKTFISKFRDRQLKKIKKTGQNIQ